MKCQHNLATWSVASVTERVCNSGEGEKAYLCDRFDRFLLTHSRAREA